MSGSGSSSSRARLLRLLLKDGAPVEEVEAYVRAHPESLVKKAPAAGGGGGSKEASSSSGGGGGGGGGCPILHDVLRRGPRAGVVVGPEKIAFLLRADPECVCAKDESSGQYPLHVAARQGHNLEIVRQLTDLFPGALSIRDAEGNIPIRYSIESGDLEVAAYMAERHIGPIDGSPNRYGVPLLHDALASSYGDANFIRILIDRIPRCCELADDSNGWLPLHMASTVSNDVELFRMILEAYPEAVTQTDHNLNLPLHIAASECDTVDIVQELVDRYPAGLEQTNADGHLPVDLAAHSVNNNPEAEEVLDVLYQNDSWW